jgi:2-keto-myo-inositol isomerase
MFKGIALHTGTLDTTPFSDVLRIARETGWDAIELRRVDFARAAEAGRAADEVLAQVRASGLAVACVGSVGGWMWSSEADAAGPLAAVAESCDWAAALDCPFVMGGVEQGTGSDDLAAERLHRVGEIAAARGVRFALEPQSQAKQYSTPSRTHEVVAKANHPNVGLLIDTYHVQRTTGGLSEYEALNPAELFYVQYSDVPADSAPGQTRDRLAPGQGVVPFKEAFAILAAKGYDWYASYEALSPAIWAADPTAVAREGAEATRARLPG